MADIEDKIREIRTRISQANARTARAQVEKEAAQKRLADATDVLKNEFGVSSIADAKALLGTMREDLQALIADAEAKLEEAEA